MVSVEVRSLKFNKVHKLLIFVDTKFCLGSDTMQVHVNNCAVHGKVKAVPTNLHVSESWRITVLSICTILCIVSVYSICTVYESVCACSHLEHLGGIILLFLHGLCVLLSIPIERPLSPLQVFTVRERENVAGCWHAFRHDPLQMKEEL